VNVATINKCIEDDTRSPCAHRTPTCTMGSKKYVLWNTDMCHVAEILRKTAFPRKISLKSDNRSLSNGQKRFLIIWRPSAIFNFKKIICIWSHVCHRVPSLLLCTKFYQIGWFYRATRMHSADYAVARCPSVRLSLRLSVTRQYCVWTVTRILDFFTTG